MSILSLSSRYAFGIGALAIILWFLTGLSRYGIAATQAGIVFILFMRLKGQPSLKWLFAAAGFFWLLFFYGLGMTDDATRRGWP